MCNVWKGPRTIFIHAYKFFCYTSQFVNKSRTRALSMKVIFQLLMQFSLVYLIFALDIPNIKISVVFNRIFQVNKPCVRCLLHSTSAVLTAGASVGVIT